MKIKQTDIDGQISEAFDGLTEWAKDSRCLGRIAKTPGGQHERSVTNAFYCQLLKNEWVDVDLQVEHSQGSFRRDIVGLSSSKMVFAVEVKTPFTNSDGIRNKTSKKEHLPKDLKSLKAALDAGAVRAYYLWTPIGCYPVDSRGQMIVLAPNSIIENEKAVKQRFKIQWPTRPEYESTGKPEVERAMKAGADEHGLRATKIKGWTRVNLPSPQPGLYAFLDCTLFRLSKKR